MFRENFSNVKVHSNRTTSKQQSKASCRLFDAIHTVDRLKLAQKLSNEDPSPREST